MLKGGLKRKLRPSYENINVYSNLLLTSVHVRLVLQSTAVDTVCSVPPSVDVAWVSR